MMKIESGNESAGLGDWYAVYTRHQHEKKVAESFAGNGIETFLPLYDSARRWKDRTKQLSLPLFSCYVFLRAGIERRTEILSTPGVYSIVTAGKSLATIPHSEIEAIRRAIESPLPVAPHPFVRVGDRVRIITGPLLGIEGIVLREKGSFRLILSAALLEKSVAVEVDASSIELASSLTSERPDSCILAGSGFRPHMNPRPEMNASALKA
jgi:transcription antitermination factor NusG